MSKATFYIHVSGTPSDPQDHGVPGFSAVVVDLSDNPGKGEIAGAVLDEFHDHVAIAMLEDFEITVIDSTGATLSQGADYDERSMQHIAEFDGLLGQDDIPLLVLSRTGRH